MSPTHSALDDTAEVFDALGHPTRRRILDLLRASPGTTVGELAEYFDTGRIAVMHHLRQLEDSGLVISLKEGRARRLFHNPVPIQLIYDRWTTEYAGFWASKMADIQYAVEQQAHSGGSDGGSSSDNRATRVEDRNQGKDRGRVA
jgi:DNA-binding transcriptional ArsR family regulator